MTPPTRKAEWLVWGGLFLVIATIFVLYVVKEVQHRRSGAATLPVLSVVGDFTLTNQNGQATTLSDLRGQPWIADIIFTRCPGPCLKMSAQMKELRDALPTQSHARLVTLTTDPVYDTPKILRDYIERLKLDAKPDRWLFLTGTKEQIAKLAVDSLKLAAVEKEAAQRESVNDLFIHSTIFVLVDKQGRMRAFFETTGEGIDFQQVKPRILETLQRLERER